MAEKKRKRKKEQKKRLMEKEQQGDRLEPNHINNHIEHKWSKQPN